MSIHGIGIDAADVPRISRLQRSSGGFVRHWFTRDEIARCDAAERPELAYAGRFAAKEAVWKALRLEGWPGAVPWRLIAIRDEGVRVRVELAGEVATRAADAGIGPIQVDWLVADSVAVAVAIAESR
ncbi:MAG: 4'-phosphopantetheinyl transferase superfamily protein [Propionibacteriaceae bacterium]|nr:4'-phosphopantetheinyl transferase superfamily protein [Propionibacteriaceae bacterium]